MSTPTDILLLDTNVLVHLIRGGVIGQRISDDHQLLQRSERPLISIVTVGELRSLATKLGWGVSKQRHLDELISELVVVSIDRDFIIHYYAQIDHYSERVIRPPRPMGQNDLWIAATAAAAGAKLLTTDRDFDHLSPPFIDLALVDRNTGATL